MLILGLWGLSFHAVVVFGLDKNLLVKPILGRCALQSYKVCSSSDFYFGQIINMFTKTKATIKNNQMQNKKHKTQKSEHCII